MTCVPQLCVLCVFQWTGEPWVSVGTMPKRRAAESLVKLCLSSVADNMKEWARDYADNYLDQYSFLYIMGPFNQLRKDPRTPLSVCSPCTALCLVQACFSGIYIVVFVCFPVLSSTVPPARHAGIQGWKFQQYYRKVLF